MILRVYHSKLNHFNETIARRSQYQAVADVTAQVNIFTTEALDVAFRDTNHIDCSWWDNETVKKLVPENVRSTSVGDLIENTETGEFWLCMNAGWSQVLLNSED